jgi:hypothetical protein
MGFGGDGARTMMLVFRLPANSVSYNVADESACAHLADAASISSGRLDHRSPTQCSRTRPAVLPRERDRMGPSRRHRPITTMMLVRGLVERDSTGGLKMTPQGREVFKVLIGG